MRIKTTPNQAIQHDGRWLKRMVLFATVLAVTLLMPLSAIAGTWEWDRKTVVFTFSGNANLTQYELVKNMSDKNKTGLNRFDTDGKVFEGYFAAQGGFAATGWRITNGSLNNNNTGGRYLSVLNLYANSTVTFTFTGTINIVNAKGETQSAVTSETAINISNNGDLDLKVERGTYISSIKIVFQNSQIIENKDIYGNIIRPDGFIDGMPYYRYRLSSRWFAEPTISEGNATTTYTVENYSSANCTSTTEKTVATYQWKSVENIGNTFDLMFINEGWCKVTANNGYVSQSYLVECWDNEAYYTVKYVEGQGMTYKFEMDPDIEDQWQQGGVLKNRVVTAVPGLTVKFGIPVHDYYEYQQYPQGEEWKDQGIPFGTSEETWAAQHGNLDNHLQPNTCIVSNYDGYMVSYVNDNWGWWDRYPHNNHSWPAQGTFYIFEATSNGVLRLGGYKGGASGEVYLVNLDNTADRITLISRGSAVGHYENLQEINLKAGDRYALHGESTDEENYWENGVKGRWAPFGLEWFSFDSNIKMTDHYGVSAKTGYEIATSGRTFNSKETFTTSDTNTGLKARIMGRKGTVKTTASVTIDTDGTLKFTNVSFDNESKDKAGGALKVRIYIPSDNSHTDWREGDAYMDYVMTIPYGNHVWDFRSTENQDQPSARLKASDVGSYTPAQLVSMMTANGDDWSRVYKVHRKTNGSWTELTSPIFAARGSVVGNNAFYMDNTNGLVFLTSGESFGAEETANINGTVYENGQGLVGVDDNIEYNYDWTTITGAEKVWIKGKKASILFPGVKAGQYIKFYTYRHADGKGEIFKAKNLVDLDNVPYIYDDDDTDDENNNNTHTFKLRGFGNGTKYPAFKGDNMRGCAIFRVPSDYVASNDPDDLPSITLNDYGWTMIFRIEIMDEFEPDLILTTHTLAADATDDDAPTDDDLPIEYDSAPSSIVLRYNASGTIIPVKKGFRAISANTGCQNANTCEYIVEKDAGVTVDENRVTWSSPRGVNYNALLLTFKGGNGLVRLVQREKANAAGTTVTNAVAGASGYVIDKNEYYIAVGELKAKPYPYTWDFTDYNMYRLNSTTKTALDGTTANAYGNWKKNTSDQSGNTFGQNAFEVVDFDNDTYDHNATSTKQLFAQGAQLTAKNAYISESEGIGVRRPYGNQRTFDFMESGAITQRPYDTYDLQDGAISFDGNALTGAGEMTIPDVAAGMYVFVKANNAPTVTGAKAATRYNSAKDVYQYVTEAKGDVVIAFSDPTTEVYSVGVTNMEKFISKYKYATESRDTTIDYIYTGTQDLTKVFVSDEVNAYGVKDYSETYNLQGVNIDGQTHLEATPNVSRTAPVNVVNRQTGIVLHTNKAVATSGSYIPLFVPAVNHQTAADWTFKAAVEGEGGSDAVVYNDVSNLNGVNMMAPCVAGKTFTEETEGANTVFILSATYYKYHQSTGQNEGTFEGVGFYRLKLSTTAADNYLRPNTSYLLIPTTNLQTALWNTSSGNGANQVVMFAEDLDGIYDVDAIEGVTVDGESFIFDDNAVYYTLSGVKLNGKPSAKGLYICNGKKVLVK